MLIQKNYLPLIWYKAIAEIRAEAARAYLGFVWWVIEPVLYMAAFYVVFGLVLNRGGENFVPFLLCGLVVWKWFASAVLNSANAIQANSGLMQQVYLPKIIFPSISILVNTIKFLVVFILLIVFLLVYGYEPAMSWLYLPLLLLTQFLFISFIAGLISSIVPFIPDMRLMVENIMMLLLFLSGIFFDLSRVQEPMQSYLQLNPMAIVIDSYRSVLLESIAPELIYLIVINAVSVVGIICVSLIFRRYDRIYPKVLI